MVHSQNNTSYLATDQHISNIDIADLEELTYRLGYFDHLVLYRPMCIRINCLINICLWEIPHCMIYAFLTNHLCQCLNVNVSSVEQCWLALVMLTYGQPCMIIYLLRSRDLTCSIYSAMWLYARNTMSQSPLSNIQKC